MTTEKIKEKAKQLNQNNKLLDEETSLQLAKNKAGENQVTPPKLEIQNLVPGLYQITLVAKVKNIFSTNQFNGGQVRNVAIKDSTGETQLTFWNEHAEIAEILTPGNKIKIKNVKTSYNNYHDKTVLHVQKNTVIKDLDYEMKIKK